VSCWSFLLNIAVRDRDLTLNFGMAVRDRDHDLRFGSAGTVLVSGSGSSIGEVHEEYVFSCRLAEVLTP
jgi:hypothetical protein